MSKVAFNTLVHKEDKESFLEIVFLEKASVAKQGEKKTNADVFRDMISLYKQHNTNMQIGA